MKGKTEQVEQIEQSEQSNLKNWTIAQLSLSQFRLTARTAYTRTDYRKWYTIEFLANKEIAFITHTLSWLEIIENAVWYNYPINAVHPAALEYYTYVTELKQKIEEGRKNADAITTATAATKAII